MLVYRGYKMNNTEKIDQIRIYYMNPDLYSKKNKEEIEKISKKVWLIFILVLITQ